MNQSLKDKFGFLLAVIFSFGFGYFSPTLAQTQIYRSLQAGVTSAIATNALGSLTISGTTATFSAAMPDSIGVGDVINYNVALVSIAFISGRTSSTVFTVQNATGGTPTAITTDVGWNIYRAYTSWQNVDDGAENSGIPIGVRNFESGNRNLVTANEKLNVAMYRSTFGDANFHGWTLDSTRRIKFYAPYATSEVGTTQRHLGVNSGVRVLVTGAWTTQGGTAERHFDFEGLVFAYNSSNCDALYFHSATSASIQTVKDCIFVGRDGSLCSGGGFGIISDATQAGTLKISNCIFYNHDDVGASNNSSFAIDINAGTVYIYNCTDYASNRSYNRDGGTVIIKNSISNSSDNDGFFGTFDASSDYNVSDRAADAPGSNSKQSTSVSFLNAAGLDFHLNSGDTGAGNSGTDLSGDANLPVTTDIDRAARPTGANTVDIGADEGVQTAAEIDVKGNNTSIVDGDATPATSDSTDFGSVLVTGSTRSVTYKIKNTGEQSLTLSGTPKVAVAGTHAADFTVTTQPSSPIAGLDSVTFVVTFDPSATGVRSATLSIANNDADENPYNWSIQGTGVTREIAVKGNNTDIADGSTSASSANFTNFGTVAPITGTASRTFKILNSGTSNLTLSGSPKVALTGDASFSVTSQPSSPVAGGDSTSFVILFAPQTAGSKTAAVSITNDDADENPFDFVISGLAASSDDGAYFTRFDTLSVTLAGAGAKDTLWVTPSLDGRMTLSTSSPAKVPGRTVSFPKKLTIWTDRIVGAANSYKGIIYPVNALTGTLSKNDSTFFIGSSGSAASVVSGSNYAITTSNARGYGIVLIQTSSGTNTFRFAIQSSH